MYSQTTTHMKTPKNINIKAFWKGTIMADINFKPSLFSKIESQLKYNFFAGYTDKELPYEIQKAVNYLDHNESMYALEASLKGHYTAPGQRQQIIDMCLINELVKRGIRNNDDNFGLMIMKSYK